MTGALDAPGGPGEYCGVALPVPLDKVFTYLVPERDSGRIVPGCRVLVPFGTRSLVGVVLEVHRTDPGFDLKPVKEVLDAEPSLDRGLLDLARWIARYYCAPIGEVLKAMLPLKGERLAKSVVSLTADGRAESEAMVVAAGVDEEVLESLRTKPLTLQHLSRKHQGATEAVRRLSRRGLVRIDRVEQNRDPTRARDAVLHVEMGDPAAGPEKPDAGQRWLLEFLRRNPGRHDLRALAVERRDAVSVARKLARSGAVRIQADLSPHRPTGGGKRFDASPTQQRAMDAILPAVRQRRFETFLLHGVTGSGKTEVYLRAIEETVATGRSALLLVPEIALTPALASQFFERFGDRVALLHSGLSDAQRADQWRRIRSGAASVVLGTRSAVFAPVRDLGLVIVDEEHDSSYKQGEAPRYNGRDVAILRARTAGAPAVLGSATPGIETRYNAETGKYTLLTMPNRILDRPLPTVRRVDMRSEFAETGRTHLFSREMVGEVRACVDRGEQAMILLNRRGFSSYVVCRSCGERIDCPNCSVTLTFHKRERHLLCHYCDHSEAVPGSCTACGREFLHFQGSGSEKVEEELSRQFPEARIARLDRDTVKGRDRYETILDGFRRGESNLLVGTQMIAKGHDIPNVTLVCVVDADVGLGRPDFRAAERTFQLLTQVAGRAGRGEKPGLVLIQTMNPDHYSIQLAARHDYDAFYRREKGFRRELWYPPFTSMASVTIRSSDLSVATKAAAELARHLQPEPEGLRLLGPASAPLVRLRTDYRFQLLVKSLRRPAIAKLLSKARRFADQRQWPATGLVLDVDPVDFL